MSDNKPILPNPPVFYPGGEPSDAKLKKDLSVINIRSCPIQNQDQFTEIMTAILTKAVDDALVKRMSKLEQDLTDALQRNSELRNRSTSDKDERDALRRVAEAAHVLREISLGDSMGDAFTALQKVADALDAAKAKGFFTP